ncbi:XisH family protein [Microcystis aeruginosa]|uniref:XisH protein n=1 Tax=Microcystis aeruginosa SPC777 TaxID=482300 RepID=S3JI36_MICAE|nr:XisH family protein [Microcystis aeruginosa]NCR96774.1 fatty-acid synthase [Microcystis aeruginosa L311-01]OCY13031.1 MAG: fatty-acid synthase [Microcystis aeruginosa CACIAM 03]TRU07916.1 MAG: fatty-acid synthase [Microcystis aeruginosa Ma_MB_F_20061100_S19D]TRU13175.1 MAG: fatty-acid synthase [Microcystis aeruginosa Ma_MB_F_20061100_S19]EPF19867.1 XisH protein [Microcystis aeruginosa SPC777]
MPAKDIYHDTVRTALDKDGWTITHDPLIIRWGKRDLYIDLGAEKIIAAEKDNQKIAIEIKSFVGKLSIDDLEKALGQYILYYDLLTKLKSERTLYLAIHQQAFADIEDPIGQVLLDNKRLKLLIFDEIEEVILRWIV